MKSKTNPIEDLETIRKIMEKSSRFLSLSGLSGVFTGLIACAGAAVAFFIIRNGDAGNGSLAGLTAEDTSPIRIRLVIDAAIVLFAAISVASYLSYRKSIRLGVKIWSPVSKRLLTSMLIPLLTGGAFIIMLTVQEQYNLLIPSMLIFYGMALVNAGKFTYNDIFYLGLSEIFIGLVSMPFPRFGMCFWIAGFGILHIAYGIVMYRKYEK
jgi:hypothetical protein